MQAQEPTEHEATVACESSCSTRSPRVRRYSCSASREVLDGNLHEVRKDKVPCCQELPVKSSMPGAHEAKPKPTGPSRHHLRAPDPANKHTPSTKHRSKAWVQGPRQLCFQASFGTAPGPTSGPGRRLSSLHMSLTSHVGITL